MAVYFIQVGDAGPVKIGTADDVGARLRDLQCANPETLNLRGTAEGGVALERQLHRHFAEHRIRGEWFHPSRAVLDAAVCLPKMAVHHDLQPLREPKSEIVLRAIEIAGGTERFCAVVGVSPSSLVNWRRHGVPDTKCVAVERATNGAVRAEALVKDRVRRLRAQAATPASAA